MKVLIMHDNLPQHDRSGADFRLWQIIETLVRQHHAVTFVGRDKLANVQYQDNLEAIGVNVYNGDANHLRNSGAGADEGTELNQVLTGRFDIAILTVWFWSRIPVAEQYFDQIRALSPDTRIAVLTDDRHGLRHHLLGRVTGRPEDFQLAADYERREVEIYRNADLVLTISKAEQEYIEARSSDTPVLVIPFSVEVRDPKHAYHERSGLCFIADFDNYAGQDAVTWFIHDHWPRLSEQIAGLRFTVAGNKARQVLSRPLENVTCLDHLPDLSVVFDTHRVFVSPLRFGTGISTKNVLAMAHGIPVVTTSVGAQSLQVTDGRITAVADSVEEFAETVASVYNDESLWNALSTNSLKHISEKFSREALARSVMNALAIVEA